MPTDPVDPVFLAALTSVAVAAAPAAVMGLGTVVGLRAWRRSRVQPGWSLAIAALAGVLLAAAAIVAGPLAPELNLAEILRSESRWDISGEDLVGQRFPAALTGLTEVLNLPLTSLPQSVAWLIRAAIMTFAAAIAVALLALPLPRALATSLAAVLVAGVTTLFMLYAACLGPWLLNLLNFWSLGLLLALFCYWRHGTL